MTMRQARMLKLRRKGEVDTGFLVGNLCERENLEDLGVDGCLKLIFKKQELRGSRQGQLASPCNYDNEPSGCVKCGVFFDWLRNCQDTGPLNLVSQLSSPSIIESRGTVVCTTASFSGCCGLKSRQKPTILTDVCHDYSHSSPPPRKNSRAPSEIWSQTLSLYTLSPIYYLL